MRMGASARERSSRKRLAAQVEQEGALQRAALRVTAPKQSTAMVRRLAAAPAHQSANGWLESKGGRRRTREVHSTRKEVTQRSRNRKPRLKHCKVKKERQRNPLVVRTSTTFICSPRWRHNELEAEGERQGNII